MEQETSNNNSTDSETNQTIAMYGCEDKWTFSKRDRSPEVYLSNNYLTAHFHPNWSKGTAGIRGTRILNNGRYYWELKVSQRVFGTRSVLRWLFWWKFNFNCAIDYSSMMFGIGTRKARLHVNSFTNLLGEDVNGWGLSHKGLTWHGGIAKQFCNRFKENEATKIGILYDGIAGTLTYYKDDSCKLRLLCLWLNYLWV